MTNSNWRVSLKALREFGGISNEELATFLTQSYEQGRRWLEAECMHHMAVSPVMLKRELMERLKSSTTGQGVDACTIEEILREQSDASPLSAERKLANSFPQIISEFHCQDLGPIPTAVDHVVNCHGSPSLDTIAQAMQLGFKPALAKQMTAEAETTRIVIEAIHTYARAAGFTVEGGHACSDHIFVLPLEGSTYTIVRKDAQAASASCGCMKHTIFQPNGNSINSRIVQGTLVVKEPGSNITAEQLADELAKEAFSAWCYNAADNCHVDTWALGVYGNRVIRVYYLSFNTALDAQVFFNNMPCNLIRGVISCTLSYELTTSPNGLVVNEQTLRAVEVILGGFVSAGADIHIFMPEYVPQKTQANTHTVDRRFDVAMDLHPAAADTSPGVHKDNAHGEDVTSSSTKRQRVLKD